MHTKANTKIYWYLRLHTRLIRRRSHILATFTIWDMRTRAMWNVYLQANRNNRLNRVCCKVAWFLRKIQTSHVKNSRILRIKNAEFSGQCVYMSSNRYSEILKSALLSVPLM